MIRRIRISRLKNLRNLGTLAVVGSICSILAFFFGMFGEKNLWVLAIGYTVFAFSLSAITLYEMHFRKKIEIQSTTYQEKTEIERLKARRVIDAYEGKSYEFHLIFHCLREATTLLLISEEFNKDRHARFKSCMEKCLSHVAQFFTQLTGCKCAACIKLLLDSGDPI